MILLVDNYDSFTYNLYQLVEEFGHHCEVRRNDAISLEEIESLKPDAIVISPGPGGPEESGISLPLIGRFSGRIPILGVCLGHQAIAASFGGKVVRNSRPVHGKTSPLQHRGRGLFAGMRSPFRATRYHSLIVAREGLPSCLEITCETSDGTIMGLRHRQLAVEGIQFHPESIATEGGAVLIRNFLASLGGTS